MPYVSIFHYFFIGVLIFQSAYMGISYVILKRKDTFFFFLFLFLSIPNFIVLNYPLFNISLEEFQQSKLLNFFYFPISSIIVGFYYLFIIQFLEFKSTNKLLYKFLYLNVVCDILAGLIFGVLEYFNIPYMNAFVGLAFIAYIASIATIYFISKSKLKYSPIILFGMICSTLGSSAGLILIYLYGKNPPIAPHFFTEIGMMFDIFIYSIALTLKWNENEKLLLEEQFEKQTAVSKERQRISTEMHDELGGNLTSLMYLAEQLKMETPENIKISKIQNTSSDISSNINEIVWSLNQEKNMLKDWVFYTKVRLVEMLENSDMLYSFDISDHVPDRLLSDLEKRNLYLVLKEAVNNVLKHSKANSCNVTMNFSKGIKLTVIDDGIGFLENGTPKPGGGNGLKNMSHRMEEIGGNITWKNGEGTTVTITHT
jgi:signal transduction histidine kinase